MKIKWYLDQAMSDSSLKLSLALADLQIDHKIIALHELMRSYDWFNGDDYWRSDVDQIKFFYGTIPFIRESDKRHFTADANSISYCNWDNLRWMDYAPYIPQYLWNKDYTVLPCLEIIRTRNPEWMWFVKPDRSTKPFEAFVSQQSGWPTIKTDLRELCVIAPKKVPIQEWRCWMVEGFSGGASYSPEIGDPAPYNVLEFANAVHGTLKDKASTPDRAYTIDIGADAKGNLGVIELNSFSCAGIYLNDPQKVIELVRCVNNTVVEAVEKQN